MKAFRALLIVCSAITLSAGVVTAQDAGPGQGGPGRWGPGRGGQFEGQRGGPGMRGGRRNMRMRRRGMHRMQDPVARLLDHQTALHLSAAQVNSIITIDNKLRADNKPLVQQLMAMREGMRRNRSQQQGGNAGGAPARPSSAQRDSAMTIMRTIRENTWRATAAANAVLTPDQLNTAGNLGQRGPMMFMRQGMAPPPAARR
jgi:hypothetical protein